MAILTHQKTWPYSVPNDTAAYNLYFIASASGDTIASSGIFNLTLPAGETRGQAEGTVGPYGTHPDTDYPPATGSSHSLSGGAIAGIVVGCCVAGALGALGIYFFVRRRNRRSRLLSMEDEKQDKPELDASGAPGLGHRRDKTMDTVFSTELGTNEDEKSRIASHEMESDTKDYLRYELPSTPPPPVELAGNEIPAAEMPSPDPATDEKSPLRLGDWTLHEAPTPRRPESVLSGQTERASSIRSGSTTLRGGREMSFAEALHDIVSQELRRKE